MRNRRRDNRQLGSIIPIAALAGLVLTVMMIGGVTLARVVDARREAQRAADATAMAAVDAVREHGAGAPTAGAMMLGQHNTRLPLSIAPPGFGVDPARNRLVADAVVEADVEAPRFIFEDGRIPVRARSRAFINQELKATDDKGPPWVVLALDYSGSMQANFGGGARAIDLLEDGLRNQLFDAAQDIRFAAVLWDHRILGEASFDEGIPRILELFQENDAEGWTYTDEALSTARSHLCEAARRGGTPYLLLVSDGLPNNPTNRPGAAAAPDGQDHESLALREANRLWDDPECAPTIMTLHLGVIDWAKDFLVQVSGTPENRGDEELYFRITNMADFEITLEQLLTSLLCRTDPLEVEGALPPWLDRSIRLFLRRGGETRLPRIPQDLPGTVLENRSTPAYGFDPDSKRFVFTRAACDLIHRDGYQVVVRYGRPRLLE
jgi:hypothetical protein